MTLSSIRFVRIAPNGQPIVKEYKVPKQESMEAINSTPDEDLINDITGIVVSYLNKKLNSTNFFSVENPSEEIILPDVDSGGSDLQGSYIRYYTIPTRMNGPSQSAIGLQLGRKTNNNIPQTAAIYTILIDETSLKDKNVEEETKTLIKEVVESLLYQAVPLLAERARARGYMNLKIKEF